MLLLHSYQVLCLKVYCDVQDANYKNRAGVLIIALLTAAVYIALTVLQFIGGPSSGT